MKPLKKNPIFSEQKKIEDGRPSTHDALDDIQHILRLTSLRFGLGV